MSDIKREIVYAINKLIGKYPIIALTGPRQSGKTTVLKMAFPDYRYLNLENPDIRDFAEKDPNGFLKEYSEKVIFDEIQRVPHLFSYLQGIVDESGMMGRPQVGRVIAARRRVEESPHSIGQHAG